jgi:hypothetical protein
VLITRSNLNHRRYGIDDDTLYVAPSSKHTDYSQPPLNNFYNGVLNTGRRRYAHPALSGKLPFPWLPAVAKTRAFGDGAKERRGVVLSLRRKTASKLNRGQRGGSEEAASDGSAQAKSGAANLPEDWMPRDRWDEASGLETAGADSQNETRQIGSSSSSSSNVNPWGDPQASSRPRPSRRELSFDPGSGVIALPDEANVWDDQESEGDDDEEHGEAVSPVGPLQLVL